MENFIERIVESPINDNPNKLDFTKVGNHATVRIVGYDWNGMRGSLDIGKFTFTNFENDLEKFIYDNAGDFSNVIGCIVNIYDDYKSTLNHYTFSAFNHSETINFDENDKVDWSEDLPE